LYRPWIDHAQLIHRQLRDGPQRFASRSGVMVVATAQACQEVVRDRGYGVRTRAGGTPGGATDGARDQRLDRERRRRDARDWRTLAATGERPAVGRGGRRRGDSALPRLRRPPGAARRRSLLLSEFARLPLEVVG
jgi:hypothetical protein